MFIDEWLEDVVHHSLERSWGVRESEEHHGRFEHSIWGFERGFPFIALLDANVVVSPSDVEFGKDERMDQISDGLFDVWQGTIVLDGVSIQDTIILNRAIFAILFRYIKHG